jgi:hypothetical protein
MAITKIQSESLNLADTYDFTGTVTGAGGVNTPNFSYYKSGSSQVISNATVTKITYFNAQSYDTHSAFSSGRFTVPSGQAGKYCFFVTISSDATSVNTTNYFQLEFKKNGTLTQGTNNMLRPAYAQFQIFTVSELSVGDYIEVFIYQDSGSSIQLDGNTRTFFAGYKLIE